jgi:hypothetical protein
MARNLPSKDSIKMTGHIAGNVAKHSSALTKLVPAFSKLNKRQQGAIATLKSLQGHYPDDKKYTDKIIKERIFSYLGVASGEYSEHKKVGENEKGDVTRSSQKRMMPKGYAHGGKIHRGRKATYNG